MTRYRQRPPEVEAVQWVGDLDPVMQLFPGSYRGEGEEASTCFVVTEMGTMSVPLNYWITKGVLGGNANYMPDESFQQLYEEVPVADDVEADER